MIEIKKEGREKKIFTREFFIPTGIKPFGRAPVTVRTVTHSPPDLGQETGLAYRMYRYHVSGQTLKQGKVYFHIWNFLIRTGIIHRGKSPVTVQTRCSSHLGQGTGPAYFSVTRQRASELPDSGPSPFSKDSTFCNSLQIKKAIEIRDSRIRTEIFRIRIRPCEIIPDPKPLESGGSDP